jgi:hypothetical protein
MRPAVKVAAVTTIVLASALTGVYQYGRHLIIKEATKKQCDDIFDLAREVMKENRQAS